ncbi:MAG: tetratricopeptide repeat protein [Elusimicrobia bacterium]|nr:tetratricopeptide repeat protein [Elusimicrobiota bacterium]
MKIYRLLTALLVLGAATPASASRPQEPAGQRTVWDELMSQQAMRKLRSGYDLLTAGRYDLAVREFSRAVLSDPKNPQAHMMLGVAYYWYGDVDQSLAEYRETLRLDPRNAQAHQLLGIAYAWKAQTMEAYEAFTKAVGLDPSRSDIHMNLGSVLDSMNRVPEALESFRKAVNLEPENPLYLFQLGMVYNQIGREAEAAETFAKALKFYPEFQDALLELGATYERDGQYDKAREPFNKAVKFKKGDAVARLRLGLNYMRGGDVQSARKVLEDAFFLTPTSKGNSIALSVAYSGRDRGAADGGTTERVRSDEEAASKQRSLETFEKNLRRIPVNQEAEVQAQLTYVPRPELVMAKGTEAPGDRGGSLKQALEKSIGSPPSAMILQREFNLRSGNFKQRDEQIRKLLSELQATLDQIPPEANVHVGMNINYRSPHDPQSAEASARAAYEPRNIGNDLGLWVKGTGWMNLVKEVVPVLAGMLEENGAQSETWILLGLAHLTLGNAETAGSSFEKAMEISPRDSLAYLGLGVAWIEAGREDRAVETYKKLLEIAPKNKVAKQSLEWLTRPLETDEIKNAVP